MPYWSWNASFSLNIFPLKKLMTDDIARGLKHSAISKLEVAIMPLCLPDVSFSGAGSIPVAGIKIRIGDEFYKHA